MFQKPSHKIDSRLCIKVYILVNQFNYGHQKFSIFLSTKLTSTNQLKKEHGERRFKQSGAKS